MLRAVRKLFLRQPQTYLSGVEGGKRNPSIGASERWVSISRSYFDAHVRDDSCSRLQSRVRSHRCTARRVTCPAQLI